MVEGVYREKWSCIVPKYARVVLIGYWETRVTPSDIINVVIIIFNTKEFIFSPHVQKKLFLIYIYGRKLENQKIQKNSQIVSQNFDFFCTKS
jgi:hypothetical protein